MAPGREGAQGIGQEVNGIRCVLFPSLATVLRDVFDCVGLPCTLVVRGDEIHITE